jgi:hypothetical protein
MRDGRHLPLKSDDRMLQRYGHQVTNSMTR